LSPDTASAAGIRAIDLEMICTSHTKERGGRGTFDSTLQARQPSLHVDVHNRHG
jgi:hypothetical protein